MTTILKYLFMIELAAIIAVSYLGFQIHSAASALSHVVAGIFALIVILFVHCLGLFYLNGTARAIKEAVEGHDDLAAEWIPFTRRIRKEAYPPATFAILFVLVGGFAGGYVHSELIAAGRERVNFAIDYRAALRDGRDVSRFEAQLGEDERAAVAAVLESEHRTRESYDRAIAAAAVFPVRSVELWWIHLALIVVALPVSFWAFAVNFDLVAQNAEGIRQLNGVLAAREAASASSRDEAGSDSAGVEGASRSAGPTPTG